MIDTATWKVITTQKVGAHPTQLALQPDGKYLWVGNDNGVTLLDPVNFEVIKEIKTGEGRDGMAFTPDSRHVFLSYKKEGQVAVIDTARLTRTKEIKIGQSAGALSYSPLSQSLYVVDELEGNLMILDEEKLEISDRIKIKAGASALRFSPDGRWGFIVNTGENLVQIIDASTNRLHKRLKMGKRPDKISFTETFAYIRSLDTEDVHMIRLDTLEKGNEVSTFKFQGGERQPGESSRIGIGDAIVPTPERNAVLVANPADKTIHYYMEGMNALMGSFQNEDREPNRLLLLDRSLHETAPGKYIAGTKLRWKGIYDVAFLLDSPRIVHCFDLTVKKNPDLKEKRRSIPFRAVSLLKENKVYVGEKFKFQFKLFDTSTDEPQIGVEDVRVLTLLSPGTWKRRDLSKPVGDGVYEAALSVPKKGIYYLFFESSKLNMKRDEIRFLILHAVERSQSN